ncbi:helical backbone metal receptor [Paenibacillus sp. Marseille-Q4541]|uniref:helical backbone metal receptor n=1 Tax=Paenibacillus sp. Marseille-Q4541 TaxID=2831522 RepID=UPI001BA57367|nr:helical backbone metal receptor [Paenibacillus sp. Marseille-Q4541]
MKKGSWKLGIIALTMVVMAACGNQEGAGSETNNAAQQQVTADSTTATDSSENNAPEADKATAEVNVDEAQVEQILSQFDNKTPSTTVTLSVAIAEIFNDLGLPLAGVPTTQSELPEAYKDVQKVGSSHQPDLEMMASLSPDVILSPESIKDSINKMLEPAALKGAYLPVDSLDGLKASMVAMGRLYGKEAEAEQVLSSFAEQEAEIVKSVEGKEAPSVMFLFGSTDYLMLMNEDTFAGSLARNLGATNVLAETMKSTETYVPFNMESIVEADPDVILLVAHGDAEAVAKKFEEDVKKNGAWEKMSAFKNGKMQTLDYNLFGVASLSKTPDAYKALSSVLYGE